MSYSSDRIDLDLKNKFKDVLMTSYDHNLTVAEKLALAMAHEEVAAEIRMNAAIQARKSEN